MAKKRPIPCPPLSSHKDLIVDTQFLKNNCARYLHNGKKIPKEQHINEPFTMMVCMAVGIKKTVSFTRIDFITW